MATRRSNKKSDSLSKSKRAAPPRGGKAAEASKRPKARKGVAVAKPGRTRRTSREAVPMPQIPQNNQDLKELDARVEALLDQMHAASDRILQHLDESDPFPPAPRSDLFTDAPQAAAQSPSTPGNDELGRAVDSMLEHATDAAAAAGTADLPHDEAHTDEPQPHHADEAHADAGPEAAPPTDDPEPVDTHETGTDTGDLEPVREHAPAQVAGALLQRNFEPPAMFASSSAAVEPEPVTIASLDEHLAGAGDDLIEGDIADEASVIVDSTPAPPPFAPPPPPPPPPPPQLQRAMEAAVAAPAVGRETTTTWPSGTSSTPVREQAPPAAKAPARTRTRPSIPRPVLRAMDATSAPVRNKPNARRIAGYVAVITAFNAICLLAYNFLVREAHPPAPAVIDPKDDPANIDPRAKPADAHGSGGSAKATNSHGVEVSHRSKVKPASKKKSGGSTGHGGGH